MNQHLLIQVHLFFNTTVAPKALTTKPITVQDKQYDATTTATIDTELIGVVFGDDVSLDFGKAEFATSDVGNDLDVTIRPFTISGTDAGNYTLTQPVLTVKGKIIPKLISIIPDAKSKVFGSADPAFTYTHSELIGSDTITGELKRKVGEEVGKYDFDITGLTASDNYVLELDASSAFEVTKTAGKASLAVTKSTTAPIDVILSASVSGNDGQVEFYIMGEKIKTVNVENGLATATYKPVSIGNYTATCKLVSSKNYTDTTSSKVDFTVSRSEMTPPTLPTPPSFPEVVAPSRPITSVSNKTTSKKDSPPAVPKAITPPMVEVKDTNAVVEEQEDDYPLTISNPFWENNLTQEAAEDVPEQLHTPSLIVIDITEGVDMSAYSPMLSEQNIQKEVIGVYSAKLLLDGFEVEPDQTVEVTIPITGKLTEYTDHDIYHMTSSFQSVKVKSISAEAITFETNNLGYFAVLGEPANVQTTGTVGGNSNGTNWWSIVMWSVFGLGCIGVIWFVLILLLKKNKEEETETAQ